MPSGSCTYALSTLQSGILRTGRIMPSQLPCDNKYGAVVGPPAIVNKRPQIWLKFFRVAVLSFGIAEAVLILRVCALCAISIILNVVLDFNQYPDRWTTEGICGSWFISRCIMITIHSVRWEKLFVRLLIGLFASESSNLIFRPSLIITPGSRNNLGDSEYIYPTEGDEA